MRIIKTKRFQNGRFNYSIKYKQMQIDVNEGLDSPEMPEKCLVLCHQETVKYIGWPWLFGTRVQFGACEDTADYYRQ